MSALDRSLYRPSPRAWEDLAAAIDGDLSPFDLEADELMGNTDCINGCTVEPDGRCPHGFESAALTGGII